MRERERKRERGSEKDRERERKGDYESNCFMNSAATVRPLELIASFIALISLSMSSMNCHMVR